MASEGGSENFNGTVQAAAERGEAWAQFELGEQYYLERRNYGDWSEGYKQKLRDAEAIWTKAAQQNYWPAQDRLAELLISRAGAGGKKEAAEWRRRAAEAPNAPAEAQRKYANMLQSGDLVSTDNSKALTFYRKAAEQADAEAQWNLGMALLDNTNIPAFERTQEAAHWLRKAVEWRDPRNIVEHLAISEEMKAKLARDISGKPDPNRELAIGKMLRDGTLIPSSQDEALKLFERAIAQFRENAEKYGWCGDQLQLARMLRDGLGTEKNETEAASWMEKAAAHDERFAACRKVARIELAIMRRDGVGAPPDHREAALWFWRGGGWREAARELVRHYLGSVH